ncbi:hypothetical protein ACHAQA_008151 [Verticillium albo-atrum]
MILRITRSLYTADKAAFFITCKALFCVAGRAPTPLHGTARRVLLRTLERDPGVGDHLYYCGFCIQLHRFDPWWGPQDWHVDPAQAKACAGWFHPTNVMYKPHSWYAFSTTLFPHAVRVGYRHGRLVMNRHRHGAPCGLPLERLRIDQVSWTCGTWPENRLARTAAMEPRILNGELFLAITSTVTAVDSRCSLQELREIIKALDIRVCSHGGMKLTTPRHDFKPAWLLGLYERWRPVPASRAPFLAWAPYMSSRTRRTVDSCGACTTDAMSWYELRAEEGKGIGVGPSHRWMFTLETYHQLGPCWRPEDFERRGFLWCGWEEEAFRPRDYREPVRDMVAHPEGAVLVRWQVGDARLLDFGGG